MRKEDYTEELREKHSLVQTKLWQGLEYRKMQSTSHSKKRGPRTKHVLKACTWCSGVFEVAPWENYRKFCSQECYGKYESVYCVGSRASHWKGGRAKGRSKNSSPSSFFNRTERELFKERDGYVCFLCGVTEEESLDLFGRSLALHHIDYDKYNLNQLNFILLCSKCHPQTNHDREKWFRLFSSFVQQNLTNRKIIDFEYMITRKPRVW